MDTIVTIVNSSLLNTVLGIVIGGLITVLVSKRYYIKSGDQLISELEQTRRARRRQLLFEISLNMGYATKYSFNKDLTLTLIGSDIETKIAELNDICNPGSLTMLEIKISNINIACEQPDYTDEKIYALLDEAIEVANEIRNKL